MSEQDTSITVGRYMLHRKIAKGGMATIHIAHLVGDVGFSRIVAAKRLHPELAQDREFVTMFLDEARIASKIHHRNVVPVLDVVTMNEEVILVQDFVHGVPMSWLAKTCLERGARVPLPIAVSVICQVLAGLHAAHETTDELGTPLHVVHRDVSPQNVMVASDGTARLLDFGVAKAAMANHVTRAGMFKGKIAYAAPEQLRGRATRQSDIYAAAVMLWELVANRRLNPSSQGQTAQITSILTGAIPKLADVLAEERAWLGDSWHYIEQIQLVLDRGLAIDVRQRWATAVDMEAALADVMPPAPNHEVAAWVREIGRDFLDARDKLIALEEGSWRRRCAAARPPTEVIVDELPAVPRTTTAEQPPTPATELPAPAPRPALMQRPIVMIAACATVGIALAFGIAFVGRSVEPAPQARRPAAATPAPRDHTVARPVTNPVLPPVVLPAATADPPPTVRRPPPPKATPPKPAPTPSASSSCSPPYYFVGQKKVFKPNCG
ncbi:MAG: protein kinase [Myxococcales bacterium]|nr:protein kinase [Myxococcales bacterium]